MMAAASGSARRGPDRPSHVVTACGFLALISMYRPFLDGGRLELTSNGPVPGPAARAGGPQAGRPPTATLSPARPGPGATYRRPNGGVSTVNCRGFGDSRQPVGSPSSSPSHGLGGARPLRLGLGLGQATNLNFK